MSFALIKYTVNDWISVALTRLHANGERPDFEAGNQAGRQTHALETVHTIQNGDIFFFSFQKSHFINSEEGPRDTAPAKVCIGAGIVSAAGIYSLYKGEHAGTQLVKTLAHNKTSSR